MALFSKPIDKAAAELSKLREIREKLEGDDIADRARLTELRAGQGDVELAELLGGPRPAKPKDSIEALVGDAKALRFEIIEIEARIQGRAAARPKLLDRIREAVRSHANARAEVFRKQVGPLRAKYDAHMSETARMLKELQEHAGCRFEMRLTPVFPTGTAFIQQDLIPVVPKFRFMEAEITKLRTEADAIEAKANQVCEGGAAVGCNLEELLCAIGDNPLAPTRAEVEKWFAATAAKADEVWKNGLGAPIAGLPPAFESGDPNFTVTWGPDGRIDREKSRFVHRQLTRPYGPPPFGPLVLSPSKVA